MIDHKEVVETLKNNIRHIRKSRKLTGAEFAKLTGISRPYLSQIESGKRDVGLSTLIKLANGLGLTVNDLITSPDSFNQRVEVESIRTALDGLNSRLEAIENPKRIERPVREVMIKCEYGGRLPVYFTEEQASKNT